MEYFIIDFDSTFVKTESLEEFASVVLEKRKDKEEVLKKIQNITKQGMEGTITFEKSLFERMQLLTGTKYHIKQTVKILQKKISASVKRNKSFFKKYRNQIYIISGGFKELIEPVIKTYGIPADHVYANTFIVDAKGHITGYDQKNNLAQRNGKVKAVQSLHLQGDIYVIGDGYTDFQIKQMGTAKHFIAFTENVKREIVVEKADKEAGSFDEFLYVNKLPMSYSYPKNRIKVLLLERIHNEAVKRFEKEGYPVECHEQSLSPEKLVEKINSVSILGVRSRTSIDERIISKAKRLLTIGVYGIGINHVNLAICSKKGISVFNAPYSNTRSVVELVLGEIILLIRGIIDKNTKMHNGIWNKSSTNAHEIRGKTLGIIGYGNIGSQLSVLAESLGMNVCFYDIVDKLALGNAKKCKTLGELLERADVITVHVDGNPRNNNLIGENEFSKMKDNVIFINSSRGSVVNLQALTSSIKKNKVRGAAIDVFPHEPKGNDEQFVSELQNLPNVILTPHIGGSTEEAQKNIGVFVTEKIIDYINNGNTYLSVNIPQIQLPQMKQAHRLLHLHHNVPGILAQINGILAKNNINILGQYLKTNEQIGYVITDVNKKYDVKVLEELKKIPNTIRFRVLY